MACSRLVVILITLATLMFSADRAHSAPAETAEYRLGAAADQDQLIFVQVNGVQLAYRLEGSGVPVIFVHGEGYSHELWTRQVEAFSEQYLFISYDRRGHGQSEDPLTGYSETAHAEDLNALMKHLGIRDAHFVVNSRGGAIIIQFLKLYGDKVRSITFADATIPLAPISEQSAFSAVVPHLTAPPPSLEAAVRGREGAKTSAFTKVAQSRPEVAAILNRMVDQYSPRVAMNPQRSDMAAAIHIGPWNVHDFPDMAKIHQPMLLIVAELGDVFFIDGATEAHRLWPNSRYHLFPGVDHLLMLEEPEEFNRLVMDFIADAEERIAGRQKWSGKTSAGGM